MDIEFSEDMYVGYEFCLFESKDPHVDDTPSNITTGCTHEQTHRCLDTKGGE